MTSGSDTFELTRDPTKQTELYVRAFNAGDIEAVNRLYTEDAISVWEPGRPLTGAARKQEVAAFLQQRPRMTAKLRESFVTGDTTLLVVDWTIDVDGPDGQTTHLSGVGLDVLRKGADGYWRYAVDSPFGDAAAP